MNDNLPPLPPACGAETLSAIGCGYTEDDMQAYARAALAEAAQSMPDGMVPVPVELLKRAESSLGSFCSDHGWGSADMDTMDAISSALAASPAQPVCPQASQPQSSVRAWQDRIKDTHPQSCLKYWPDALKVEYMEQEIFELRTLAAQPVQPSEPYAWIRPNGINHSGVAHIGKTCPPGWPGATAVYINPVAQAKPEQAAQQWLPIETAPKDAVILLGYEPSPRLEGSRRVYEGRWHEATNQWGSVNGFIVHDEATHWMPLPAAPQPKD